MIRWLIVIALLPTCASAQTIYCDTVWNTASTACTAKLDSLSQSTVFTNGGTWTELLCANYVGKDTYVSRIVIGNFDWDNCDANDHIRVTVDTARILFTTYNTSGSSAPGSYSVDGARVLRKINWSYVCWDNYASGMGWQNEGAKGPLDIVASPLLWSDTLTNNTNYPNATHSYDVTEWVDSVIDGSVVDEGVLIYLNNATTKLFAVRDSSDTDTLEPHIILYWHVDKPSTDVVTMPYIVDNGQEVVSVAFAHEPVFKVGPAYNADDSVAWEYRTLFRTADSIHIPDWITHNNVHHAQIDIKLAPPFGGHLSGYQDTIPIYCYQVFQDWEVSVGGVQGKEPNWEFASDGVYWSDSGGCAANGVDADSLPFAVINVGVDTGGWYRIHIPGDVARSWVHRDSLNTGFVMIAGGESDGSKSDRYFYSFNAPDDSLWPKISYDSIMPPPGRLRESVSGVGMSDSYNGPTPLDVK